MNILKDVKAMFCPKALVIQLSLQCTLLVIGTWTNSVLTVPLIMILFDLISGETVEDRRPIRPIMIYVHGESFSWGSGKKRTFKHTLGLRTEFRVLNCKKYDGAKFVEA